MDNYVLVPKNDELCHYGTKGMKWGIRLYQRKDGTLTNLGKMRYNRELEKVRKEEQILKNKQATKAKLDKLEARKAKLNAGKEALDPEGVEARKKKAEAAVAKKEAKAAKKEAKVQAKADEEAKKKSVKDMSDDELAAAIRRIQLEKQYSQLTSVEVKKGKGFVSEYILPPVGSAAKTVLTDFAIKKGKEFLGLNEKKPEDPTVALKKAVEKLNLEKQYKDLTNPKSDPLASLRQEAQELSLRSQIEKLKEDKDKK